jgi:excisionase family DNA binding protein
MEERYLSLSEAADALDISERTAHRWIKAGKLRSYKPGRDHKIPQSAIIEAIEAGEVRPKAPSRSRSELTFNGLLEEERRRAELGEIREIYHGPGEALERYCERWERRLAEDDLALQAVREFLIAADAWLPILQEAVVSESLELARVVGSTEDDRVSDEMRAESVMLPAAYRYHEIGRRLQKVWQERFASDANASDSPVVDFTKPHDIRLRAVG